MSESADYTVALATKVTLEHYGVTRMNVDAAFTEVRAELVDLFYCFPPALENRRDVRGKVIYTRIIGVISMLEVCLSFVTMHNDIKLYGKDTVEAALEYFRGEADEDQNGETDDVVLTLEELAAMQENSLFDLPRLPRDILKTGF